MLAGARTTLALSSIVAAISGCSGSSTAPPDARAASITMTTGDAQVGPAGAALPNKVRAYVQDANAKPVAGATVAATVVSGDSRVSPSIYTTDASGHVDITWTMGTHLRDTNRLAMTVGALPPLVASARAEVPTDVRLVSLGDPPATLPGEPVPTPIVVQVTVPDGRPLVGAPMEWVIFWAGGAMPTNPCDCGSITSADTITDSTGRVTATFTMGDDRRGALELTARVYPFVTTSLYSINSVQVPLTWQVSRFFSTIASGYDHSCALTPTGVAYCWGYDQSGPIADGGELGTTAGTPLERPGPVDGGHTFTQLALGAYHSCGLTAVHELYCWGDNRGGEFGDGTRTSRPLPTLIATTPQFVWIAGGFQITCGLTSDGTAYCWGFNALGALGDGTTDDRLTPTPVAGGLHFSSIVMLTGNAACGLTTNGHAYCWGSNNTGRLGDGTTVDHLTPQPVSGGLTFTQLMGGVDHACGLAVGGSVYCWGDNTTGQLGDGTQTARLAPTAVAGGIAFQSLGSGMPSYYSCGVAVDGTGYCWGDDYGPELGVGSQTAAHLPVCNGPGISVYCTLTPLRVFGPHVFERMSLNLFSVCALTVSDGAYCWGDDSAGENGDGFRGTSNQWPALVAEATGSDVADIARGRFGSSRFSVGTRRAPSQSRVPDRHGRAAAQLARP